MNTSKSTWKTICRFFVAAILLASCAKDEEAAPSANTGGSGCPAPTACNTVLDIDGHSYTTVQVGSQCWMVENLRVSRYRNGDAIPQGTADPAWLALTTGAYGVYEDNAANEETYGKLYNWFAVADPRGLCPNGWHVATDADWKALETSLGMPPNELDTLHMYRGQTDNVGGKLKSTSSWNGSTNSGANNCSGLAFKPAGTLGAINNGSGPVATFGNQGEMAWVWTSTDYNADHAMIRALFRNSTGVWRSNGAKLVGMACRCVAD